MGTVVVVRHAQGSLFSGDYDQLSDVGREQAVALGRYWARRNTRFDAVFSGPAKRHLDTAAIVADELDQDVDAWPECRRIEQLDEHDAFAMLRSVVPDLLEVDDQLRTLNQQVNSTKDTGEKSRVFQRMFEHVMARWLAGEIDPGQAETWEVFRARIHGGLEAVLESTGRGRTAVVFTSVGPIAVMLQRALMLSDLRAFQTAWRLRNCAVSEFVFRDDELTLDRFNALPHLADPRLETFR